MVRDNQPTGTIALRGIRTAAYIALMKPELTLLSVITAVGGAYLASIDEVDYLLLLHVFVGTMLAGGGAGALNQTIERKYDALMKRTENRPLPAGRIHPREAGLFGTMLAVSGMAYLLLFTTTGAAILALVTLCTYLGIYTPLKRKTPFATVAGSIPGALPPLIGWTAVRGGVSIESWSLFFILFFWQMPHFLSLAWLYRKDYERGGYPLLTVVDPSGTIASRQILVYSSVLIPAAVMPTLVGLSGMLYFSGALVLSVLFLAVSLHLFIERNNTSARLLFFASLLYLPLLFFLMMVDRIA